MKWLTSVLHILVNHQLTTKLDHDLAFCGTFFQKKSLFTPIKTLFGVNLHLVLYTSFQTTFNHSIPISCEDLSEECTLTHLIAPAFFNLIEVSKKLLFIDVYQNESLLAAHTTKARGASVFVLPPLLEQSISEPVQVLRPTTINKSTLFLLHNQRQMPALSDTQSNPNS